MEYIKSRNNQLIKNIKKLFVSSKYRHETGMFVLEGARLCFDAMKSDYEIEILLITDSSRARYKDECETAENQAVRIILIDDDVAVKLSDTENTQGIFAVVKMKAAQTLQALKGKYVAFDSLQNPLNVGAIIRTADALGMDGAICYNCCDIYNPKALRASMGSILRLPLFFSSDLYNDLKEAKDNGVKIYSAVVNHDAEDLSQISFSDDSVMVIGNEANGVSENINSISNLITIPMHSKAESLNAMAAASIILWEMTK